MLATLKKENRDKFKNYLDDLKHAGSPEFSGGAVSVVIGKLEYPYIIRVSSLPSVSEYFQSEKPKIIIETAGDKKPRKNKKGKSEKKNSHQDWFKRTDTGRREARCNPHVSPR